MVWSEQIAYPFYIYNNDGKLVATFDENGLTVYEPDTFTPLSSYVRLNPSSPYSGFNPAIEFVDLTDVAVIGWRQFGDATGLDIDDGRDWEDIPLSANFTWTTYARSKLTPLHTVMLAGAVTYTPGGAIPNGTVVGTMPDFHYPHLDWMAPVCFDGSAVKGRLMIREATGNIEVYDAPNNTLRLDGIYFPTDS